MTDEQWEAIQKYVVERLERESPFEITVKDLAAELGLNQPIYQEMIDRGLAAPPPFRMKSWLRNQEANYDPIDPITFSE